MTNWKESDLKKIGLKVTQTKLNTKTIIKSERISKEKESISTVLFVLNRDKVIPEYEEELRFHPVRRWRFDWAIPELKIAIEYEGLISKKSRHTTIKGYSNDTIKYNEAGKHGWTVLRYTALTYQNLHEDLMYIINKQS